MTRKLAPRSVYPLIAGASVGFLADSLRSFLLGVGALLVGAAVDEHRGVRVTDYREEWRP